MTSLPTRQITPSRKRSPSPKRQISPSPDPHGLDEFSVVYTNRAINHMSKKFQGAMKDISSTLKEVYGAHSAVLVPGGGTYAMESVARQFGAGRKCMVVRNGYFSYRWSQILSTGSIASKEIILKGQPVEQGDNPAYAPLDINKVVKCIAEEQPSVVFAPHVETSSGIILPDAYMKAVAEAVHNVGGIFVLDCIASGCMWVNMREIGVDVLISAPQKGWSSSAGAGIVMLSQEARALLQERQSTAFALDLNKWIAVMEAYEQGGHMYHATMPTDSIMRFRDIQQESKAYGFDAPGVVVSYTSDQEMKTGAKFASLGMQIAAGVPLMLDEFTTSSPDFRTFRLGLFGIDKLQKIPDTVARLDAVMSTLTPSSTPWFSKL